MHDSATAKKLMWIIGLLAANMVIMAGMTIALVWGLLPKIERAVQTTERVESRFQAFADEVQPVVIASAGKAIETIEKMDAKRLSETATEKADSLMKAAADKAKRILENDKNAGSDSEQ